eukprot:CAMPEP_0196782126 /NCGR_PEP_ID=MMETSP1104-20130614/10762_1 /TAXON_ID=33652 /ORGANISM="Cafeteria sp., Strain Caron Lab Isolate" /LENGTH=429 /DNA_ID=CAMNT_0042152357 /DNA_START=89 /DNA_END=1378 /DNA_ORIENTATION=+
MTGQPGSSPPPVPATGLDVPPCRGLTIGTSLHASNVVDDGYTLATWAFGRGGQEAMVVGGEDQVTTFFFEMAGDKSLPLKAVFLNSTHPDVSGEVIRPVLSGSLSQSPTTVDNSTAELSVDYRCTPHGGNSILWVTVIVDKDVAKSVCQRDSGGDLTIHFLWHKFCPKARAKRKGLAVGTLPGTGNVVMDGEVLSSWEVGTQSVEVSASMASTTFYVSVTDGTTEAMAPPQLQGTFEGKLHAVVGGPGSHGGTLGEEPLVFTVNYFCAPSSRPSQSTMTVVLLLCNSSKPGEQCSSDQTKYEPVTFQWTKNCIADPGMSGLTSFLAVVFVLSVLACGLGCVYKWQYQGARGMEIVPFIDTLRKCVYDFTDFLTLGRRSRETVRYKQAYMSEEDALAEAGEVQGGYSVDASLDDDDVLQVPQGGGYGTLN